MRIPLLFLPLSLAHGLLAQGSVPELHRSTDAGQRVFEQRIAGAGAARPRIWPMDSVEVGPSHPEGEAALMLHLAKAEGCPDVAMEEDCHLHAQVMLHLVVGVDGTVSGIRTDGDACPALAARVRCAAGRLPRLRPGMKNGEAVQVRMRLPIRYELR